MSHQNLQARLSKLHLSTDFIEQLSDALEHDFFADLSLEYKKKHFNVQSIVEEPTAKYGKSESPQALAATLACIAGNTPATLCFTVNLKI